jgi:periplasmic divalent cation tolerance protein
MHLAWTTVANAADADRLAQGAVAARLAACVQVDGPVVSHYTWQGRLETAREYRLLFKLLPEQAAALEAWVLAHHPYETPEWVVVPAERVSEKYLSWARSTSTPAPFPNQPPSA